MSRLDRDRAYQVLRTDWRDLPPKQREQAFLDALEQCIVDDLTPFQRDLRSLMHPSLNVFYLALSAWCIVGSILRLIIQTSHGQPIDLLPFITLALGIVATWRYLRTPTGPRRTGDDT